VIGTGDEVAPLEHGQEIFEMLGETEKYLYTRHSWVHEDFIIGNRELGGLGDYFVQQMVSFIETGDHGNSKNPQGDDD